VNGDPDVIKALNLALKWELTLAGCYCGYHEYFERWKIRRLAKWFGHKAKRAGKRADKLMDRINALDSVPKQAAFVFDVEPLDEAKDLIEVFAYFAGDKGTLPAAAAAYEAAHAAATEAEDGVSASLAHRLKCGVEHDLAHAEAKLNKIRLVGPEAYIAHHMH
jgi:bacterioferritin (cytochrome b1)